MLFGHSNQYGDVGVSGLPGKDEVDAMGQGDE